MMFPFRWILFGRNFAWYILYSISYDFPKGNVNFLRICSLANLMNQSILKLPMTHPTQGNPPPPPGIWLFYQNFGEIPWYFGSLDGQMRMPHTYQLVLQKVSNPSPTIQKFSHASNCLFKCKYPTKHNQNKENPFACDADQCFGMKVKCLTWVGGGTFWVKFPTVWNKTPVKCLGYALGGEGSFELTGYTYNLDTHVKRDK